MPYYEVSIPVPEPVPVPVPIPVPVPVSVLKKLCSGRSGSGSGAGNFLKQSSSSGFKLWGLDFGSGTRDNIYEKKKYKYLSRGKNNGRFHLVVKLIYYPPFAKVFCNRLNRTDGSANLLIHIKDHISHNPILFSL